MSDNRQDNFAEKQKSFSNLRSEDIEKLIDGVFADDDIDAELLDELLEIYDKLDDVPAIDTDAALERFKSDYIGQDEIYRTENADNTTQTGNVKKDIRPHNQRRMPRYRYIAAVIIITILALLYGTPVGASVRLTIATWTSETFSFGQRRFDTQINPELGSLHTALVDNGVTEKLAPTWLPDGFVLFDFIVSKSPNQTVINAMLRADTKEITIHIVILRGISTYSYEKDENAIEVYPHNGIDHYIMTNISKTNAVWATKNYECIISGDITVDEVKQMIDSIYER